MGRQGSSSKTDGIKKEKITISLRAIFKGERASPKSHAKLNRKLKKRALTQRQQKKENILRHAYCS